MVGTKLVTVLLFASNTHPWKMLIKHPLIWALSCFEIKVWDYPPGSESLMLDSFKQFLAHNRPLSFDIFPFLRRLYHSPTGKAELNKIYIELAQKVPQSLHHYQLMQQITLVSFSDSQSSLLKLPILI